MPSCRVAEHTHPSAAVSVPDCSDPGTNTGVQQVLDRLQLDAGHRVSDLNCRADKTRIGPIESEDQVIELAQSRSPLCDPTLLVGEPLWQPEGFDDCRVGVDRPSARAPFPSFENAGRHMVRAALGELDWIDRRELDPDPIAVDGDFL